MSQAARAATSRPAALHPLLYPRRVRGVTVFATRKSEAPARFRPSLADRNLPFLGRAADRPVADAG
jgi:hypothetical protein